MDEEAERKILAEGDEGQQEPLEKEDRHLEMMKLFAPGSGFTGCKILKLIIDYLVPPQEGGVDYKE